MGERVRYCFTVQIRAFGSRVCHVLGVYTVRSKALANMKRLITSYMDEGKRVTPVEDATEPDCFLWVDVGDRNCEDHTQDKPLYSVYGRRYKMDSLLAAAEGD